MRRETRFVGSIHLPNNKLKISWKDYFKMLMGYRPTFSLCLPIEVIYRKELDDVFITAHSYSCEMEMLKDNEEPSKTAPAKVGFEKVHNT